MKMQVAFRAKEKSLVEREMKEFLAYKQNTASVLVQEEIEVFLFQDAYRLSSRENTVDWVGTVEYECGDPEYVSVPRSRR